MFFARSIVASVSVKRADLIYLDQNRIRHVLASARTGWNGRPTERTAIKTHIHFNRRIATRIENFTGDNDMNRSF